jgi:hypothetical protein
MLAIPDRGRQKPEIERRRKSTQRNTGKRYVIAGLEFHGVMEFELGASASVIEIIACGFEKKMKKKWGNLKSLLDKFAASP